MRDKFLFFTKKGPVYHLISVIFAYVSFYSWKQSNESDIGNFNLRFFNALSKALQALKVYRLMNRSETIKKIFTVVFISIPLLSYIIIYIILMLYIYVFIGMDLFATIHTQNNFNNYDVDFSDITKTIFTLIRIATGEAWFLIMSDSIRKMQPNFHCIKINNLNEFRIFGKRGCGKDIAYFYFLSFHLIFSLFLSNLLIAMILIIYTHQYNSEEKAINSYKLNEINKLWTEFDPKATGFISFKNLWVFAAKISKKFGVETQEMIKVNYRRNFLKMLKIDLYENKKISTYCYKFHDVIISLTKVLAMIKLNTIEYIFYVFY